MCIELITEEDPLGSRIGLDRLSEVGHKVQLGSGRSDGFTYDFPAGHLEGANQAKGPMSAIFILAFLDLSRFGSLGRRNSL